MKYNLRRLRYPKNFIMDMYNHSTKKVLEVSMGIITYPKNTDEVILYRNEGLKFILSCLTEDEREIIRLKYKDRQTTSYIARYFKTNVHDIGKRVQKIRSKLIHPSRFAYILHDLSENTNEGYLSFDKNKFNEIQKDDFIDLLDLSERITNALFRNGIYRISDIINVKNDNGRKIRWYSRLRNIGVCAAREIDGKLKELNFI